MSADAVRAWFSTPERPIGFFGAARGGSVGDRLGAAFPRDLVSPLAWAVLGRFDRFAALAARMLMKPLHRVHLSRANMSVMKAVGYCRVSTDKQADHGVSLEAQRAKIQAMAVVHGAELIEIIVDGGESAKTLKRPGMEQILALVEAKQIQAVIVAKLDRLTRSVKDLCQLLERFERRGVALISVAESLDTQSAAGRLVINIMTAVSQWEREAIGERTRDALGHKRAQRERVGNIGFGYRLAADGVHVEPDRRRTGRHSRSYSASRLPRSLAY